MGLNGFFERTLKVTASRAPRHVSLGFVFRCRLLEGLEESVAVLNVLFSVQDQT